MLRYTYKNSYLFFFKNCRVEFKYVSFLKKLLKKLKRRGLKKQKSTVYKLYISLTKNYCLSKKSKNSRMGKGKGSFIREAIKVKKFRPFIYSTGYGVQSLSRLAHAFSSKTNVKLSCFAATGFDRQNLWSNNFYGYDYTKSFLLN